MCMGEQGSTVLKGVLLPVNGPWSCLYAVAARGCVLPFGSTCSYHFPLSCRQIIPEIKVISVLTDSIANADKEKCLQ